MLRASRTPEWDALLSQGRQLPNVSDQIFVLCQIAEACQSRNRSKCLAILEEAYRIAQGLFCVYDRVSRISMIAVQALEVDKGFWRRLLESGMEHSIEAESDEVWPVQREILDFAHRITQISLLHLSPKRTQIKHEPARVVLLLVALRF